MATDRSKIKAPEKKDDASDILVDFAKIRYRKEMEKSTSSPIHINDKELKELHQQIVFSTLEIVSETRPMTSKQKQDVKKILDQQFGKFEEINLRKKSSKGPAIGIDLGTTFCCLAVARNSGKVEIIPNDLGNNKTPSYISFPSASGSGGMNDYDDDDDDDSEEDIDDQPFFGEAAKYNAHENPQGTIFDVKRMLGRKYFDPQIQKDMKLWPFHVFNDNGEILVKTGSLSSHSPRELTTLLLQHLKTLAENFIGSPIVSAVVAVPAYYNSKQRELTKEACAKAGLNVLQLINEPTAAAVAYNIHQKAREAQSSKKFLIFDFGGGTFDVAVLTMRANQIHVLDVGGDPHLGGEDIDNNMVDYCIQQFKKQHGIDLKLGKSSSDPVVALKTSKRLRRLKLECEKQKKFLSQARRQVISMDAIYESKDLVVPISRQEFESLNKDIFQKCISTVDAILKRCKIDKKEIEDIVVVGGSSRIPKLQEMLSEYFGGKQLYRSIDADEAVAVGAAMLAFHAEHVEIPNVLIQEPELETVRRKDARIDGSDITKLSTQLEKTKVRPTSIIQAAYWKLLVADGLRRYSHAAVSIDRVVYSIGGNCTGSNYSSSGYIDVYKLELDQPNPKWKLIPVENDRFTTPSHRNGHTVVARRHYIYLWGGGSSRYANGLHRFNTLNFKWEKLYTTGTIPQALCGHTAVVIGNKMYTFGGLEEYTRFYSNQVHSLDLDKLVWSLISLSTKGKTVKPRYYHTAVVDKDRFMYVFGGRMHENDPLDAKVETTSGGKNVIRFDVTTNDWVELEPKGTAPGDRHFHSAFMLNKCMYVFGGYDQEKIVHLNDMFRYDPERNEWNQVIPWGQGPSPRRQFGCAALDKKVLIFGGFGPQSGVKNSDVTHADTFLLDMH